MQKEILLCIKHYDNFNKSYKIPIMIFKQFQNFLGYFMIQSSNISFYSTIVLLIIYLFYLYNKYLTNIFNKYFFNATNRKTIVF